MDIPFTRCGSDHEALIANCWRKSSRAKDRMGLFIRTIGIARATTKIGMANLVYNIERFISLHKIAIA
jgi:hypothetical protein